MPFELNALESEFIWYKCTFSAEHIPDDLAIVLDNEEFAEAHLNGERIGDHDHYTLWDDANIRFPIADKVKPGLNVLAVKAEISDYYHPDVCLPRQFSPDCTEPVALVGDFYDDTDSEGLSRLLTPRTRITQGDWGAFGMKNYIGSLTYRRTLAFDSIGEEVWLHLGTVHCVAELRINGQQIGRRSWRPYRFRIDQALVAGDNLFEITVTNTMGNLLGAKDALAYSGSNEYGPRAGLYGPIQIYSRD